MSTHFARHEGVLHLDAIALSDVAAQYGTPSYVYSAAATGNAYDAFESAFGSRQHRICYAVKANPLLAILRLLATRGAGFDVVSGGELQRVLHAGGDPTRVVFSGVGKTDEELRQALASGVGCINVESRAELQRLAVLAGQTGQSAPVALRVNLDINADTHRHIATGGLDHKFGIAAAQVPGLVRDIMSAPHLDLRGLAVHIGSQITDLEAFRAAARGLGALAVDLARDGAPLAHLDLGGGLGVGPHAPSARAYVEAIMAALPAEAPNDIHIEPGRALVAEAGVLLTRVVAIKHGPRRNFAIVDAGMNDLLRPVLYDAVHDIVEVEPPGSAPRSRYDVVGPVCETADCLGEGRNLSIRPGSLLAIMQCGAYCAAMASNYNGRPRAAEVMVDAGRTWLARRRETFADLIAAEHRTTPA